MLLAVAGKLLLLLLLLDMVLAVAEGLSGRARATYRRRGVSRPASASLSLASASLPARLPALLRLMLVLVVGLEPQLLLLLRGGARRAGGKPLVGEARGAAAFITRSTCSLSATSMRRTRASTSAARCSTRSRRAA